MVFRLIDFAFVNLKLLMFKVFESLAPQKSIFFQFNSTERVKRSTKHVKGKYYESSISISQD